MTPSSFARSLALALVAALTFAACGSTPTSPTPAPSASAEPTATPAPSTSPPAASGTPIPDAELAAIYDAIEQQVIDIRDLEPVSVQRETIDGETLKEMTVASFDEDNPPEYVAANDRLLKALGLIDEEASLKDLYLDLIGSQVAGFYRPDRKTLYVVSRSGVVNGADKITFAHEYGHALQDANFPGVFEAQEDLLDQTDQALARAAVYEGDATLLMSLWAIPNLTPAELQDVVTAGSDPESAAILARTPAFLYEGLLFPYNSGLTFVAPIQTTGGWAAVDDLFVDLPVSTEQILHPEKFQAGEAPIEVALPDGDVGDGWTVALQDTFGEFQTQIWLREAGVPTAEATAAAAGWGGDRLAVLDGPGDAWAVVMRTAWDTAADAREFEEAATIAVEGAGGPAAVLPGAGATERWFVVGSDDAALETVAGLLGLAG
jgi:hypothetical protein